MAELSPLTRIHTWRQTLKVQIMALIQVTIDYNCYHCYKDDCLGGEVPGFDEIQLQFSVALLVLMFFFKLCFDVSLQFNFGPLAFICHHNSFLIYGSLEQPTLARWSQITHVSVGSALVISAVFAVSGYATFTGYTQGKGQRSTRTTCFWVSLLSKRLHPGPICQLLQATYLRTFAGTTTWQHSAASVLASA